MSELNSQLNIPRCRECRQPLPDQDPWTSGIFDCAEDPQTCWTGLFCPCILYGRNCERLDEDIPWVVPCICHAVFVEGGMLLAAAAAFFTTGVDPKTACLIWEGLLFAWMCCATKPGSLRQSLQSKYNLKDAPCNPNLVHGCLHWCALCQEHREIKARLSHTATTTTVVNPPPRQEMDSSECNHQESATSSENSHKDGATTATATTTTTATATATVEMKHLREDSIRC